MPATPEVVGAYLAAAGEGYAMPTLRRRVAAIACACGVAGHPLDTKHPRSGRHSWGLTASMAARHDGRYADRALLLLGFAGALRRSELVGVDVDHLTWTRNGLRLIERSKTDAEGEGAEIAISRGQANGTCPVIALKTWLELSRSPLVRCSARLTVEAQSNAPG
jgi:hypothetical protein